LALLEAKISEMEGKVGSARVMDEKNVDTSKVGILTKVEVMNKKLAKEADVHYSERSGGQSQRERVFYYLANREGPDREEDRREGCRTELSGRGHGV
jgi:hypothetical protein